MTKLVIAALAAALAATPALAAKDEPLTAPGLQGALAGTLMRPAEGQPLVLIIPGSGPTDRDGNNPLGVTAAPYRLLADALAEHGIGTLRIDKRGLFGSTAAVADPNAVTIEAYGDDVESWVGAARDATGVPCVWLLGHSEGGLIALAAAQRVEHLCGVMLVAAPGLKMGDILRTQLEANPANAPILDQALPAIDRLERGEHVDPSAMHPGLQGLFNPAAQGFLIDMMRYDPAALAAKVTVPMLIVQGGKDLQVDAANGAALHAAKPDAGYVTVPEMNHVLKDVAGEERAANMAAYADPSLPVSSALVDAIAAFLADEEPEAR